MAQRRYHSLPEFEDQADLLRLVAGTAEQLSMMATVAYADCYVVGHGDVFRHPVVGMDLHAGHCSVSCDFPDRWRASDERFEHAWEDRFIRDEGYGKFMIEAMSGLLKKYNLTIKGFSKVVYPCLYPREHAAIARRLGAEPGQIQDSMLPTVGDTGSASPLMMLVAALEEARPGDKILVASFGSGSDALFFQVTEGIGEARARRAVKKHLASKKELPSYERYLAFRNRSRFTVIGSRLMNA